MKVALHPSEEDFSSLADQMGRWLDRVLGPEHQRYGPRGAWRPSVNVYEDAHAFHVVVELPGVDPDTVDLRAEGGRLLLSGERASPRPDRPGPQGGSFRVHLMEIDHGPFWRTLELPESVDVDAIEAAYRNGLLWVTMPKKA